MLFMACNRFHQALVIIPHIMILLNIPLINSERGLGLAPSCFIVILLDEIEFYMYSVKVQQKKNEKELDT